MTLVDDDRLASLLVRAADSFTVPETGPAEITARALGPSTDDAADPVPQAARPDPHETTPPGVAEVRPRLAHAPRRLAALAGRHRVLSVAASVIAVLAITGSVLTLGGGQSPPSRQAAARRGTTPAHAAAHGPGDFGLSAPAAGAASGKLPLSAARPQTTQNAGSAAPGSTTKPTTPTTAPTLPPGATGQNAKIEQNGTLGLAVGQGALSRTVSDLENLADANGGFVASSQTQSGATTGGPPSGNVTLEVPVANFAGVLKSAEALGRTTGVTTKATDVTGQYVDLQSRLSALEASRQQYLTIMASATTVGDVLAVQAQIDTIQSQIEQIQGQLEVLTNETSYSTLQVTVSEGTPAPHPPPVPESGLVRAWHDGIGGFVAGIEAVIRGAGPVLFALVCLGILLLGGRMLWRLWRRRSL